MRRFLQRAAARLQQQMRWSSLSMRRKAGWVSLAGFVVAAPASTLAGQLEGKESQVYSWGSSSNGQLGVGAWDDRGVPQLMDAVLGLDIVQVAAGGPNGALVSADGEVYTFGQGNYGALGLGDNSNCAMPTLVEGLSDVHSLDTSDRITVALTKDGRVFVCGTLLDEVHESPVEVAVNTDSTTGPVRSVACGLAHCLAVTENGQVFAWGKGKGCLGLGQEVEVKDSPTLLPSDLFGGERVVRAVAGHGFSVFLTEGGHVYTCGDSECGQCCSGKNEARYIYQPHKVRRLRKVVDVSAGDMHGACVTSTGRVFAWGMSKDGQVGQKVTHNHDPRVVDTSHVGKDDVVVQVACGNKHSAVRTRNGQVLVWGRGREGQIGRGDQIESQAALRLAPKPVVYLAKQGQKAKQIALGTDFCLAVTTE